MACFWAVDCGSDETTGWIPVCKESRILRFHRVWIGVKIDGMRSTATGGSILSTAEVTQSFVLVLPSQKADKLGKLLSGIVNFEFFDHMSKSPPICVCVCVIV
jgi:hypothetical protein